jgi:hypothetical protein
LQKVLVGCAGGQAARARVQPERKKKPPGEAGGFDAGRSLWVFEVAQGLAETASLDSLEPALPPRVLGTAR